MKVLSYIRRYYPPQKLSILLLLCVLTGILPALLIPLESTLIDQALGGIPPAGHLRFFVSLGGYLLLLAMVSLLQILLQRATQQHTLETEQTMEQERWKKACTVAFPLTETPTFHELLEQAGKAASLDTDFCTSLENAVVGTVKIVASLTVLMRIDHRVVVLLAAVLLLGIAIHANASKHADGFWGEYLQNMRRANYHSSLLLHREYAFERKIFAYGQEIGTRYEQDYAQAVRKNSVLGKQRLYAETVVTVFSVAYSVAVFLVLLSPLSSGQITLGTFTAAWTAAYQLRHVSQQIYDAVFTASNSFRQLSGFFTFLQLEETPDTAQDTPINLAAGIEFRGVSFTYPNTDTPVLEQVSFTLHPGKHYALVGENGCGKTTLVKLLLGLYQPTQGEILIGGQPIGQLTEVQRRRLFCVMFQDFYRYPLSVREIVSLSSTTPPDDSAIRTVLTMLDLQNQTIVTEKGLDTNLMPLKDGGTNLSGGEWQKLTAARCFLSDAPIAILDEPNAALDPLSEAAFYRTCGERLAGKTTLFISHRLGSVKQADEIMVLCDKKLVAMAHHEVLMDTCEYYANLFETQRGLYYGT